MFLPPPPFFSPRKIRVDEKIPLHVMYMCEVSLDHVATKLSLLSFYTIVYVIYFTHVKIPQAVKMIRKLRKMLCRKGKKILCENKVAKRAPQGEPWGPKSCTGHIEPASKCLILEPIWGYFLLFVGHCWSYLVGPY